MKILVTGGAGYIGSFMVRLLLDKGNDVVVFDNLEKGHNDAIDKRATFIKGDIRNQENLESVFNHNSFEAILHFAGYISVEESQQLPDKYYQNNVEGSRNLFDLAIKIGNVNKIIFSSTAAVYGNPQKIPIPENHPKNPTSEYGKNKLEVEQMLKTLRLENSSLSFASLRYFNAAGAALDGSMGESHSPETHIIPLAIKAAREGNEFYLYGKDYKTADGTCIRDYIHVLDLVESHLLALNKISKSTGEYFYNVGTGLGHTNKEVIQMVEKVAGKKINVIEKERRAGDPEQLVADPAKIKNDLSFEPQFSDLNTIVQSAWNWHIKQ